MTNPDPIANALQSALIANERLEMENCSLREDIRRLRRAARRSDRAFKMASGICGVIVAVAVVGWVR